MNQTNNYGWICPNCKQGVAPFVEKCDCVSATQQNPYIAPPPFIPMYPYYFQHVCFICGKLNCNDLHVSYNPVTITPNYGTSGGVIVTRTDYTPN